MDKASVEKEAKRHGTLGFPLAVYDNYDLFPEYSKTTMYLHWHDEAELVHIRRGSARVQIDDNECLLRQGDVAAIPGGSLHTAVAAGGKDFWFDAVVFSMNLLTSGMSDVTQLEYVNRIKLRSLHLPLFVRRRALWEKRVAEEVRVLISAERARVRGYEMAVKGSLFKIFAELVARGTEPPVDSRRKRHDIDRLKLVLQYIHTSYAQKLSLDDMAGLSNLSKYYFCRFFKAAVGKTPIDYLHWYRLVQAEQLLKETDLKVIDIALEVGFSDLSHFTRLFHKQAGATPSQFRARAVDAPAGPTTAT
jgi:AraC-like DNA-binding protein